jgi:hypothetical protein
VRKTQDTPFDYALMATERLRPGDHIALDFEPIQGFSQTASTQHFGVSRYLQTVNGPEIAYMGIPILRGISRVISVLNVGLPPYFTTDKVAMLDPLVHSLYCSLKLGSTLLLLQPLKADNVYVTVKSSTQPVAVLGRKAVNTSVLLSLLNYISTATLASLYSSLDIDDDSRAIISHLIVQAAG